MIKVPGKAFIAGEYAVLFGEEAIVTSVDRYAYCYFEQSGQNTDALFLSAKNICEDHGFKTKTGNYLINTKEFYKNHKLGLGSSAAATVAVCKIILKENNIHDQNLLFKLAKLSHKN